MVSNNTGSAMRRLAEQYPGRLGHLFSPGGQRGPVAGFRYALDNGCFTGFDFVKWEKLLNWANAPLWAAVPDVVGDHKETLRLWYAHSFRVTSRGFAVAFVAQDGCCPEDVPLGADVVFIGGSSAWKRKAIKPFTERHRRVHVGRVNGPALLEACYELGVESVDGTGWFHAEQLAQLAGFLRETSGAQTQGRLWQEASR